MRLCLIGCGEHATSSHGPALALYRTAHPGFELAGCCDVEAARARAFAAGFGFARPYEDAAAMLDAERPDAVVLVVPDTGSADLACLVLERALPLLLEKPPGRTPADGDRMLAAARRPDGTIVPHQVAFNRRYAPLLRTLRARLDALGGAAAIQHVRYEMVRVNRRDPDFSTTAIHGIDAVRYLAGADYAHARMRYQELPALGKGVANLFVDALLSSGATAQLSFCPVAGAVVERACLHTHGHTLLLEVPMWSGFDAPGRLQHLEHGRLVEDLRGERSEAFVQGGFAAEVAAFLDAVAEGRMPAPGLAETRQSLELACVVRARGKEYRS
jgi:myo-inositol 2-dehydrogenase / D-chiro-inositol 1-dehydrogenase